MSEGRGEIGGSPEGPDGRAEGERVNWSASANELDQYYAVARQIGAKNRGDGGQGGDASALLSGRKKRQGGRAVVDGCGKDLGNEKTYLQRYSVCEAHFKAGTALLQGQEVRFCQQCNKFQDIREFEGPRRSCAARAKDRNMRRRLQAGAGGPRPGGGSAEELNQQGNTPQQQSGGSPHRSGGGQARSGDSGNARQGSGEGSLGVASGTLAILQPPSGGAESPDVRQVGGPWGQQGTPSGPLVGSLGAAGAPADSLRRLVVNRASAPVLGSSWVRTKHDESGEGDGSGPGLGLDPGTLLVEGGAFEQLLADASLSNSAHLGLPASAPSPMVQGKGGMLVDGMGTGPGGGMGSRGAHTDVQLQLMQLHGSDSGPGAWAGRGGGGQGGGSLAGGRVTVPNMLPGALAVGARQQQLAQQGLAAPTDSGGSMGGAGLDPMSGVKRSFSARVAGDAMGGGSGWQQMARQQVLQQQQQQHLYQQQQQQQLKQQQQQQLPMQLPSPGLGMEQERMFDMQQQHAQQQQQHIVPALFRQSMPLSHDQQHRTGSPPERPEDGLALLVKERRAALLRQQQQQQLWGHARPMHLLLRQSSQSNQVLHHLQQQQAGGKQDDPPALDAPGSDSNLLSGLSPAEQLQLRLLASDGQGPGAEAGPSFGHHSSGGYAIEHSGSQSLAMRQLAAGFDAGLGLDRGSPALAAQHAQHGGSQHARPQQERNDPMDLLEEFGLAMGDGGSLAEFGFGDEQPMPQHHQQQQQQQPEERGSTPGNNMGVQAGQGGMGAMRGTTALFGMGSAPGAGAGFATREGGGLFRSAPLPGQAGGGPGSYGQVTGGSSMQPVLPHQQQPHNPMLPQAQQLQQQAGSGGRLLSGLLPGAGGREDALAVRVCLKLFDCTPEDLPHDLLFRLRRWTMAADNDVLQVFMRPGCVHLIANLRTAGGADALEASVLGGGQLAEALSALSRAFESSGLLSNRRVVVQVGERPYTSFEYSSAGGAGRAQGRWVEEEVVEAAPAVASIVPAALPCGTPIVAVITGRNLLRPGTKFYARCAGRSYELTPLVPPPVRSAAQPPAAAAPAASQDASAAASSGAPAPVTPGDQVALTPPLQAPALANRPSPSLAGAGPPQHSARLRRSSIPGPHPREQQPSPGSTLPRPALRHTQTGSSQSGAAALPSLAVSPPHLPAHHAQQQHHHAQHQHQQHYRANRNSHVSFSNAPPVVSMGGMSTPPMTSGDASAAPDTPTRTVSSSGERSSVSRSSVSHSMNGERRSFTDLASLIERTGSGVAGCIEESWESMSLDMPEMSARSDAMARPMGLWSPAREVTLARLDELGPLAPQEGQDHDGGAFGGHAGTSAAAGVAAAGWGTQGPPATEGVGLTGQQTHPAKPAQPADGEADPAAAGLGDGGSDRGVQCVFVRLPALPRQGLVCVEAVCAGVPVMGAWAPAVCCHDAAARSEINGWMRQAATNESCRWLLTELGTLLDYDAMLPSLLGSAAAPRADRPAQGRRSSSQHSSLPHSASVSSSSAGAAGARGPGAAAAAAAPMAGMQAAAAPPVQGAAGSSGTDTAQQQQQQHSSGRVAASAVTAATAANLVRGGGGAGYRSVLSVLPLPHPMQGAVTCPSGLLWGSDEPAPMAAGPLSAVQYGRAMQHYTPLVATRPDGSQDLRLLPSSTSGGLANGASLPGRAGSASAARASAGGGAAAGGAVAAGGEEGPEDEEEGPDRSSHPSTSQRSDRTDDTDQVPDARTSLPQAGASARSRLLSHPLLHPGCRRDMVNAATRLLAYTTASGLPNLATGLVEWLVALEAGLGPGHLGSTSHPSSLSGVAGATDAADGAGAAAAVAEGAAYERVLARVATVTALAAVVAASAMQRSAAGGGGRAGGGGGGGGLVGGAAPTGGSAPRAVAEPPVPASPAAAGANANALEQRAVGPHEELGSEEGTDDGEELEEDEEEDYDHDCIADPPGGVTLIAGAGLLHLAVASGSGAMVMAALDWAETYDRPWHLDQEAGVHRATPLHLAAALKDGGDTARLLLSLGPVGQDAWLTVRDGLGRTPAEIAEANGAGWLTRFCLYGEERPTPSASGDGGSSGSDSGGPPALGALPDCGAPSPGVPAAGAATAGMPRVGEAPRAALPVVPATAALAALAPAAVPAAAAVPACAVSGAGVVHAKVVRSDVSGVPVRVRLGQLATAQLLVSVLAVLLAAVLMLLL